MKACATALLVLSGCGWNCVKTAEVASGFTLPASAKVLKCSENARGDRIVVIGLDPDIFKAFRSKAAGMGYSPTSEMTEGLPNLTIKEEAPFGGLARADRTGAGSSWYAVLQDSTHSLVVVYGPNWSF